MKVIKIITGASLISKPPVNRHNHFICLGGIGKGFVLVPEPQDFSFPVALANIGHKVKKAGICLIRNLVRVGGITRNLNGYGSVIVGAGRTAPRTILFFHIHSNPAILANAIVGRSLFGSGGKDVPKGFNRTLTNHTMNGDPVNGVVAGAGFVGGNFGVADKITVAHFRCPPLQVQGWEFLHSSQPWSYHTGYQSNCQGLQCQPDS